MDNKIQSPEVIVVEASAGSGKTFALAKRYLELIINQQTKSSQFPLRNILAITFTKKATAEMKERILEFLKRTALESFEDKEQEKEIIETLGLEKKKAKQKALTLMDELINNYTFFQVQTIDSFINALLMGCALNIDRSAHFKIKQDYSSYLSYCLDSVIDLAATDAQVLKLLEDFLEHYLFIENKNSWFPKKDILNSIQYLFELNNRYGKQFHLYDGKSIDVIKMRKALFSDIGKLAKNLPEDLNATLKKSIAKFVQENDYSFELKAIPEKFKFKEVAMNKNKDAPPEFIMMWENIHAQICELMDLDANIVYSPYIELFEKIAECFNRICKHDDILFLGELNSKTRLLFNEGITIAELYYRLATRFTHFLIDEFQDTSKLQWKNLEEMIEEALSVGGSLFYVGDKKQAIYGFRGGDADLFEKVKNRFIEYAKPQILKKNWRSQKAIVEFNNKIFSKENITNAISAMDIGEDAGSKEELTEYILGVFSDSHQEYSPAKNQGYVYVERLEEDKKQERNEIVKEKIISLIGKLKERNFSYKDIAILCRDNAEVELMTSWLLEEGLSVESEKTLSIDENTLIQELVAFLRFLYSPIDDLSFASFVMGDIFTKAAGINRQDVIDFIFHLRKEKLNKNGFNLYRNFREYYPQIWDTYINEFFKSVGFVCPYELMVSVYKRLSVMDNFGDNQAFFMKFLELIKQQEDEYPGLGDFLSYLDTARREELYVNVEETDSVHVLTIHKSKGLEFSVVIAPFLRIDINAETGDIPGSFITPEEDKYGLVRITKEHRKYSKRLKEIYKKAYSRAFLNEFNNLYVALTRSRFELYIFIPRKSKNSSNKARDLIPESIRELGGQSCYEIKKEKARQVVVMPPSSYEDYVLLMKDEFGDTLLLKNRNKITQGNIIHFALSCIGNISGSQKENIIKKAIDDTKIRYPLVKDFISIEKKISRLIDASEISKFFYVDEGYVYCEKEMVNLLADTKRVDRLIIKQKEAWILDYKSSRDNCDKYNQQVKEYMEIVRNIYPEKTIRGFLLYLDEEVVEEVNG